MSRFLAPVALSFLLSFPVIAQVRESVTVEVIEVPVYVSHADGTPLRGLSREAFELSVNGRAVPVEYFDAVDYGAAPAAAPASEAPHRDLRERRLYLLLFDLIFNKDIPRLQKAADAVVWRSNPDTDYFAVATYRATRGFQFVIPFLNDRAAIHRAIATLAPAKVKDALGIATAEDERISPATERALMNTDNVSQVADSGKYAGERAEALHGGSANADLLIEPARRAAEDQLDSFKEIAERLRSLDGQKHLVVLSNGYERVFGPTDARYRRNLGEIYRAFRSGGAFIDTIDTLPFTSLNGGETLRLLAESTGGMAMRGNDLAHSLTQMMGQQQAVYLLGFRRRDKNPGDVEVRVNGLPADTRISYRKGFGAPPKAAAADALQLADILVSDIPQNGVTLSLRPLPRAGGVAIEVSVPRDEVTPQVMPSDPYVDVMLYVFDDKGATVLNKAIRLPLSGSLTLQIPAELRAGTYTAKALLQIGGTQSLGFARAEFQVND